MPKAYNPFDKLMVKARLQGFRARSVFKLKEIQDRFEIIQPGMRILDVGASPGSWLQLTSQIIGTDGEALGLDLKKIEPIAQNIHTRICDVSDLEEIKKIFEELSWNSVDLIISDIAPNTTGISHVDQVRSVALNEAIVKVADKYLVKGGNLVMKVFQGEPFTPFLKNVKRMFREVSVIKVKASRDRSNEVYVICFFKK